MTNIYFCDVCNESVPQADLDLGRALVVKGRIICTLCDRAMTQRQEARGGRPANLGLDLDAAAPAVNAPVASGAPAGVHPHSHIHASTRSASGVGLAFASSLVALATAGLLWQWTRDELRRRDDDSVRATQLAVVEQATARRELELRAERIEEQARSLAQRVDSAAAEHSASASSLSEQRGATSALGERLDELAQRVARLSEALERVPRHDEELMALQKRISAAVDESATLARRVAELELAAPVAAPPAQPEKGGEAPTWIELTTRLKSPDMAVRYEALIALAESRDPATAPYIAEVLKDTDPFLRMAAARMLGDLRAPAGVEPLLAALSDSLDVVREAAIQALRDITGRPLDFDARAPDSEREKKARQLREWWSKERAKFGA